MARALLKQGEVFRNDRRREPSVGFEPAEYVSEPLSAAPEPRRQTRPESSELHRLYEEVFRRSTAGVSGRTMSLRSWLDLAEIWRIAHALRETRGNRAAAARRLGIGRRTFYAKLKRLGIDPDRPGPA